MALATILMSYFISAIFGCGCGRWYCDRSKLIQNNACPSGEKELNDPIKQNYPVEKAHAGLACGGRTRSPNYSWRSMTALVLGRAALDGRMKPLSCPRS